MVNPSRLCKGDKLRWPEVLETKGSLGKVEGAYVIDTINLPKKTPWNSWFRTSAIDFFEDGRMVVTTLSGDVWIVSGINDKLDTLKWKRFAGGLYEALGVRVVKGLIYVTCKDRLTRLHDLNNDGEADFYESFSADDDVSVNWHAFNFDLQVDAKGNFYYAKSGQYTDYKLPGAIIKVSADGKTRSVHATGFRTPNGIGITKDGRITASDNQGWWMPASKISMVKEGGFYGYKTMDKKRMSIKTPNSFDQPMIWMPQNVDNSSGGQVWVDDKRWGPLSGHLIHTSFGKGWLYYLLIQDIEGQSQAAVITLPHNFKTGVMRARVNPADGQIYATGLNGWNAGGRKGLVDGGIQRLRYTGKNFRMINHWRVTASGVELGFNFVLDPKSVTDLANYNVSQWDYKWAGVYGSKNYLPGTEKEGIDTKNPFSKATLSKDGKRILLHATNFKPVNQMQIKMKLKTAGGADFEQSLVSTINVVPKKK